MRWFVLFLMIALVGVPGTARAEPLPGRIDLLADRLAEDPVQVTDHLARELPADAAARIRAAVGRLDVPVYVVVEPDGLTRGPEGRPDQMLPLLHDRLGEDGIYLVTGSSGSGAARQYGGSLPVADAWLTARIELPYKADAVQHVERFVEVLLAPDVRKRIAERKKAPEPEFRSRSDERDRAEMSAFGGGTALGAALTLALIAAYRLRRPARRRKKGRR